MPATNSKTARLHSDKHNRPVEVQYRCEPPDRLGKFTIWIRPTTRDVGDPRHEDDYEATFLAEGGFIRATMLSRNGFESLKGVTYDLLKNVEDQTGKAVRSSLLLHSEATAEDRDDQLQEEGEAMWRRFEEQGRATFDETERRFYLK